MKKLLLLAAVAALALNVSLWGASITVTSPNGTPWCLNSAHNITWTSSGVTQTLTIALRAVGLPPGAEPTLYIVTGTANDGTHPWTIPGTLAAGDYFVRVRTDDQTVIGDSPVFHISATPSIVVTQPNGSSWFHNTTHNITWTKVCDMQNSVTIALRAVGSAPGSEPTVYIGTSEPNDGSHPSWSVSETIPAGNYFIRVRTDDMSVIGDSVAFYIGPEMRIDPKWWLKKYLEVRWPPDPDPCLCPEWDIRELLERIRKIDPRFVGSLGLLKNGEKIQDLLLLNSRKTPLESLAPSLKPSLSRKNFDAFKNGAAKFSMGIFDAKGNLLQEIPLQGEQGQQLR